MRAPNKFISDRAENKGITEDVPMALASANHNSLLNSLTHLYSNPPLAALREYSANAADAHKAIGQTKPFEIDLRFFHAESHLNLRIRDYGEGLDKLALTTIYSQYGASTKSNNNKLAGGFGLGAKSGLAVSDSFHLRTIKNGVRIEALIAKNHENLPVLRILSESPSDEESGTEIIIPLTKQQQDELIKKASTYLIGYHPEQVLLNGSPISISVHDEKRFMPVYSGDTPVAYIHLRLPKDTLYRQMHKNESKLLGFPKYRVVMGDVYYNSVPDPGSLDAEVALSFRQAYARLIKFTDAIIFNVPIGSVDLPPHRDSLIDTKRTWQTLAALMNNTVLGLEQSSHKFLNKYSLAEATRLTAKFPTILTKEGTWKHRGDSYSNELQNCDAPPILYDLKRSYTSYRGTIDRTNLPDLFSKPDTNIIELKLPANTYEKVRDYDRQMNSRANAYSRKKPRSIHFNRTLKSVVVPTLEKLLGRENCYILITNEDVPSPAHIDSVFTHRFTLAEMKKKFSEYFSDDEVKPVPDQTVSNYVQFEKQEISCTSLEKDTSVVYFGGKDSMGIDNFISGTETTFLPLLRAISQSQGNYSELSWVRDGFRKVAGEDNTLVLLNVTSSSNKLLKAFPKAVPFAVKAREKYENYDATRQLAVRHAFTLFSQWKKNGEFPFMLLTQNAASIQKESIRVMVQEPEIAALALYILISKDHHVEGYTKWKKQFVQEIEKEVSLADLLLPIQALLHTSSYLGVSSDPKSVPTLVKALSKGNNRDLLPAETIIKYINLLTA